MAILPGGLWENGRVVCEYGFRQVDGALELALAEKIQNADSVPQAVTAVLTEALAYLGDLTPREELVDRLCIQDRQHLMRHLHAHLGEENGWHTSRCRECEQPFDFPLRLSALPVTSAPEGYPFARVTIDGQPCLFRLPTGADQKAVKDVQDNGQARSQLLARCHLPDREGGGEDSIKSRFDDPEVQAGIEKALERVAPGVINQIEASCPECGHSNVIELDSYLLLRKNPFQLLHEVHQIAFSYHWSQREILELPRARRRFYLHLIDAERGLQQ